MAPNILVFDVNETLLDLSALDAVFERVFADRGARAAWFSSLLHWSMTTTLSGRYENFTTLAGHCLDALAAARQMALAAADRDTIFDAIARLDPHPEVPETLARLRAAGFELVALTNSAQASVDAQFDHAGMTGYFSHVLSVDHVQCFKPHPKAYRLAADTLGCPMNEMRLIAAHDWDVTGAMRAGCAAAFVARGGAVLNPAGEIPDVIGTDLAEVADRLIGGSD